MLPRTRTAQAAPRLRSAGGAWSDEHGRARRRDRRSAGTRCSRARRTPKRSRSRSRPRPNGIEPLREDQAREQEQVLRPLTRPQRRDRQGCRPSRPGEPTEGGRLLGFEQGQRIGCSPARPAPGHLSKPTGFTGSSLHTRGEISVALRLRRFADGIPASPGCFCVCPARPLSPSRGGFQAGAEGRRRGELALADERKPGYGAEEHEPAAGPQDQVQPADKRRPGSGRRDPGDVRPGGGDGAGESFPAPGHDRVQVRLNAVLQQGAEPGDAGGQAADPERVADARGHPAALGRD